MLNHARTSLFAMVFGLSALPALAGGMSIDLPRLEFPLPSPETTRDCTIAPLPVAPSLCAEMSH